MTKKQLIGLGAVVLSLVLSSGCALAPIANSTTGRSLGTGEMSADIGVITAGEGPAFAGKFMVGVSENLDVGLQYELFAWGGMVKYAFLNPKSDGLAFSLFGGAGASGDGSYSYAGPIVSYKGGAIEPYAIVRYNQVKTPEHTFDFFGETTFPAQSFGYFSYSLGFALWPATWFGVSLEGTGFTYNYESTTLPVIYSGNFMFRF